MTRRIAADKPRFVGPSGGMVDAADSKSAAARLVGSSPTLGTKAPNLLKNQAILGPRATGSIRLIPDAILSILGQRPFSSLIGAGSGTWLAPKRQNYGDFVVMVKVLEAVVDCFRIRACGCGGVALLVS